MLEWKTEDSILAFLTKSRNQAGSLTDAGHKLPDEEDMEGGISFAPGLIDAMYGMDESENSKAKIEELTDLLTNIASTGDAKSQAAFYEKVTAYESVIDIIDLFLEQFGELSLAIDPYLYPFARDLATKTDNRNSVKFGIAILGLCEHKEALSAIKILGLHDEFTVFSTVALIYLSENPIQDLWELAKQVDGWGKIQLVERLADMELSPEIQEWLLLAGYKNNIMYEYLALTCAEKGGLHDKLEAAQISPELFKAAGEIIEALISEGPVAGISAYTEAATTIEYYLHHVKIKHQDISHFLVLHTIKDFLLEIQEELEDHAANGWTEDTISNCLIDVMQVLNSRKWEEDALKALKSSDEDDYWLGKQAADILKMDIWDILWNKLQESPLDSSAWYDITHHAKDAHVDQLLEYARKMIPFQEICTGPGEDVWFGPDFEKYQSHEYVIRFLGDYPQQGEDILLTGLQSVMTRNRFMTLKALEKWGQENWSDEIRTGLDKLREIEPDEDTKESLEMLLKGEEIV